MPSLTAKVCAHPGCSRVVNQPRCDEHRKQASAARVRSWEKAGGKSPYDRRWRTARAAFLAKNPLCVECLKVGRTEVATVVDHVVPHRGDQGRFWDRNNWSAICARHHNAKTARGE